MFSKSTSGQEALVITKRRISSTCFQEKKKKIAQIICFAHDAANCTSCLFPFELSLSRAVRFI